MLRQLLRPFALFIALSTNAYSSLSKETVNREVANYKSFASSSMNTYSQDCKHEIALMLADINTAHELFLSDKPLSAAIKNLHFIEETARSGIRFRQCPMYVLSRSAISLYYVTYYFEQNRAQNATHIIKEKSKTSIPPNDSDRSYLNALYSNIANKMKRQCQTIQCNKEQYELSRVAALLADESNKTNADSELMLYWTVYLRYTISKAVFTAKTDNVLSYALNGIPVLVRILKGYALDINNPSLTQKNQIKVLDDLLKANDLLSECPIILWDYYNNFSLSPTSNQSNDWLLMHLTITHKLFETMGNYFYFQKHCSTLSYVEIANYPFEFSKEVIKELIALEQ